jgi:quercetin dioxygenase-like cupin family protein
LGSAEGFLKQILLSKAYGVPTFSFRVFTIEPGAHTPLQQHPFEHMNYIIEGNGVLVTNDHEQRIEKGDFALVLPGEMHRFKVTMKHQNLIFICAVPKEYELLLTNGVKLVRYFTHNEIFLQLAKKGANSNEHLHSTFSHVHCHCAYNTSAYPFFINVFSTILRIAYCCSCKLGTLFGEQLLEYIQYR